MLYNKYTLLFEKILMQRGVKYISAVAGILLFLGVAGCENNHANKARSSLKAKPISSANN